MSGPIANPAAIPIDYLPIAVRAYVPLADMKGSKGSQPSPGPSAWVLIFDTETTTDPSQRLRFGAFQLRKSGELKEHGFFYDPAGLRKRDQKNFGQLCPCKRV